MQTNFFQQIATLATSGKLLLTIQPLADKTLVVSVLLTNKELSDLVVNTIPPLILKGSPAEIDEGFFHSITTPVKRTSELLTNLLEYQQSLEKAKNESRVQKDKEDIDKKDRDGRKKRYDEQMKKVTELEGQKKFGQAIAQLPDPSLYPEYAEDIRKKSAALKANHGSLSLFGEEPEAIPSQSSELSEAEQQGDSNPFHADDPEEVDNDSEPELDENE